MGFYELLCKIRSLNHLPRVLILLYDLINYNGIWHANHLPRDALDRVHGLRATVPLNTLNSHKLALNGGKTTIDEASYMESMGHIIILVAVKSYRYIRHLTTELLPETLLNRDAVDVISDLQWACEGRL